MRWVGYVAHMRVRNSQEMFLRKPEVKRPLRRRRRRWEENIKRYLKETGLDSAERRDQ
jgi:hypothetical protein